MKHFKLKVSAFLMASCLMCMNLFSVVGAAMKPADTTVPDVLAVTTEAQTTAAYVLSETSFEVAAEPNAYSFNGSSGFYNASRNLILAIRSGLDCSDYISKYLSGAKNMFNANGKLVIANTYGDELSGYAYLIEVLTLTENDATSFNDINVIAAFDEALNADLTTNITFVNPYKLGVIYQVVRAYSEEITNSEAILSTIEEYLNSITDNKGYDSYGYSVDNNSIVTTFSTTTDAALLSKINTIVEYTYDTFYDPTTGISIYPTYVTDQNWMPVKDEHGDYTLIPEFSSPSSDSTALALALFAQFGKAEAAAASYNALINNYKSSTVSGLFDENAYDPFYATQDVFYGLVTYKCSLEAATNPFDITDKLTKEDPTPEEEPTPDAVEESNEPAVPTGDTKNVILFVLVASLSAIAFASASKKRA